MAKTTSPKNTLADSSSLPNINYAYKPKKIGAIIATVMEAKKITKENIATYMNVSVRTVELWLERTYLSIPQMMKLSELLGEDLLLHYRSNVKPLPNPLQEELDKQTGYVKHLEGVELKYEKVLMENKSLRDRLELLQDIIEKKNSR